jgi:hypothetical protein
MVPNDGTIILPLEFRGTPVQIIVEKETTKTAVQDLLDFCTKDASLCTDEELDDARYEYLKEKYR